MLAAHDLMLIEAVSLMEAALTYLIDLASWCCNLSHIIFIHIWCLGRCHRRANRWVDRVISSSWIDHFTDVGRFIGLVVYITQHVILILKNVLFNIQSTCSILKRHGSPWFLDRLVDRHRPNWRSLPSTWTSSSWLNSSIRLIDLVYLNFLEILLVQIIDFVALCLAFDFQFLNFAIVLNSARSPLALWLSKMDLLLCSVTLQSNLLDLPRRGLNLIRYRIMLLTFVSQDGRIFDFAWHRDLFRALLMGSFGICFFHFISVMELVLVPFDLVHLSVDIEKLWVDSTHHYHLWCSLFNRIELNVLQDVSLGFTWS